MKFEDKELLLVDVQEILGELEYALMNLEDVDFDELLEKMNELKRVCREAKTELTPAIKVIEILQELRYDAADLEDLKNAEITDWIDAPKNYY